MAQKFPITMGRLEGFAHSIGGELGRATIVRLAPRGRVYRHTDKGEYYRVRDRYHLVLHKGSRPGVACWGAGGVGAPAARRVLVVQ